MTPDVFKALVDLHHGIWTADLIGQDFIWLFQNVLSPRERSVTELKIQGLNNAEISKQLGIKETTVKRVTYDIQYKYRNGMENRVSDWPVVRENLKRLGLNSKGEKQNDKKSNQKESSGESA